MPDDCRQGDRNYADERDPRRSRAINVRAVAS
jgi:hypothetical protein